MSLRGVRQLRELLVRFSDIDGSSKGIREWMQKNLLDLANKNPHISFQVETIRNRHPILRANYLNGNSKTIGVKNLTPKEINEYAEFLNNQIGRKMSSTGYAKPVVSRNPSIQGEWHERMDLIDLKFNVITK